MQHAVVYYNPDINAIIVKFENQLSSELEYSLRGLIQDFPDLKIASETHDDLLNPKTIQSRRTEEFLIENVIVLCFEYDYRSVLKELLPILHTHNISCYEHDSCRIQ